MLPFLLPGFEIQEISVTEAEITVTACATRKTAVCPACQHSSSRLHSFYTRTPADLPVSGQAVRLSLRVRRFRCQNQACQKRTFAEPLPEVVARSARQTKRLRATLKLFAVALSGRAGERLLNQLGMAVSGQTLLRLAKSIKTSGASAPEILGVDDFAFKRGRTYGAILVDLRTHRPVDLLPERTADALSLWLRSHPGVLVISRDRSTEFARGASDGAPEAVQIADRFHILQNLREACERALKRIHAELIDQHKASGHPQEIRYKRRRSNKEIRLLREHIDQLESEIVTIVNQAREGQILMSFPGFGPITAATIIAAIGSIYNFPSASALKSYVGWAPVVAQSGSALDVSYLTRGGTRTMKQIMFLAVMQVIRLRDNEWARLYERLVKARCPFDERTQSYTGKTRVIGRVAGQMIEAIYALLMRDAELLSHIPPGQEPPPPLLYDPEVHHRHRHGHYRPLKSTPPPNVITLTHLSSPE